MLGVPITMKFACLIFILSISVAVCRAEDYGSAGAIVCNDPILHIHIGNLLQAHGIDAAFVGSVWHSVEVPPGHKKEATQIIRADALKRGYPFCFGDYADQNDDWTPSHIEFKELLTHVLYTQALKLPAYSRRTVLGRFLRRRDIARLAAKYPYITLGVAKREYFAAPRKLRTGYEIQLNSNADYYINTMGRDIHDKYYWPRLTGVPANGHRRLGLSLSFPSNGISLQG